MLTSLLKIPLLRLKYKFLPNEAQEFWAQELLESQGLGAKIGQVLGQGKSSRLPKSSLSAQQAKRLFEQKYHETISVSEEVLAASMGQVFFIQIKENRYALKMLHPGIKEKLKKEIDNLLLLGTYFAKAKGFSFDKQVFKRFLTEVFEEETDLKREADFQRKFKSIFASQDKFKIADVILAYSNADFLCQEEVPCTLARDLRSIPNFDIFNFYFESLLNHGTLHGDLNDRNWGIDSNNRTVIYDFGCSQIISERRVEGLKKLIRNEDVIEGFKQLGVRLEATKFKGKEQILRDALFNPLYETPISTDFSLSRSVQKNFGDDIKQLREYTDPWVLLMMRSLFSLIKIYQDRKVTIPLGQIIAPYLVKKDLDMKASNIKIEVTENEKQVVFITLPITALDNIESLMPGHVLEEIKKENVSIPGIIERVKANGFEPEELFSLQSQNRHYRVWLD